LVAVGIGDDTAREKSKKALKQIGGKNVFYIKEYRSVDHAMNVVSERICRKYLMTICRYSNISLSGGMFVVNINDEEFVKSLRTMTIAISLCN